MRTILILLLINAVFRVGAQTHTEKLTKEFSFTEKKPSNTLMVDNMNGSVHMEGYNGDKVLVEAEMTITAKTNEALETGKKAISIGYKDLADTLILYVEGLCSSFGRQKGHNRSSGGWGYNSCNCNDNGDKWVEGESYHYKINFTIKVPQGVNVVASTINEGDITVLGVQGSVVANNINGSIKLDHLRGKTIAHTINGDLDLTYDSNPSEDCQYYTLNGNINADFSPGLAANLSFESFNGEFFTNLNEMELLPVTVEKIDSKPGIKYKINGNRYKVRNGGVNLDFETFNGNVYLKEKTTRN